MLKIIRERVNKTSRALECVKIELRVNEEYIKCNFRVCVRVKEYLLGWVQD